MVLFNTVFYIREGFSQKQYDGSKQARRALAMVGYPSDKYFKNMVHAAMISKFPVTLDAINIANEIFVLGVPSLKLKRVRWKIKPVVSN